MRSKCDCQGDVILALLGLYSLQFWATYYYQEMHTFSVQDVFTQNLHFSCFYPMFTVQWLGQIQFGLQILDQR